MSVMHWIHLREFIPLCCDLWAILSGTSRLFFFYKVTLMVEQVHASVTSQFSSRDMVQKKRP